MDDLEKYIKKRKKQNPAFSKQFEEGYENFKIGVLYVERERKLELRKKN